MWNSQVDFLTIGLNIIDSSSGVFRNVKRGADQARQARIQKCGLGGQGTRMEAPKASTGVESGECILVHSGARFRPTRPITAIMMFMTSAEVNFFTFKGGGGAQAQGPLNTPLDSSSYDNDSHHSHYPSLLSRFLTRFVTFSSFSLTLSLGYV